jgi:hypothetical protein
VPSSLKEKGAEDGVKVYLSPVKINEVIFGKIAPGDVLKSPWVKLVIAALIPEQFILIFFMALTELESNKRDPVLGIVTEFDERWKKLLRFVIDGTSSVKLVKFTVFATKVCKPEEVIDDILNDGIDSKE